MASTMPSRTSRVTGRITPMRSWQRIRRRRTSSCARWIRRSCCTTPRPSSPTAANSASAQRSGSPPAACMRAVRSGSSNSPRSSTAFSARVRRVRDPSSPARARHAYRSVRRHLRPAAPGPSRSDAAGAQAASARSDLVAGHARQPAQGHLRPRSARPAHCGGREPYPRSADRGHRVRGGSRRPLQLRDGRLSADALSGGALRLDHGRRQPAQLPSLAEMAVDRPARSDRGDRPPGAQSLFAGRRRRTGDGAGAHPRIRCPLAGRPASPGLGLPARLEVAALIHSFAGGAWPPPWRSPEHCGRWSEKPAKSPAIRIAAGSGADAQAARHRRPAARIAAGTRGWLIPLTGHTYPVCVGPGQGARGSWKRKEGPLSTPAMSRAGLGHEPPAPVSQVQLDTEETLRLVLARLDDMKAEDTTTIDLRGKSAIADYMVVTSGRSNRHVGSVADRVLEDLHKAGVPGVRVEGMPLCDWVLIDAGDGVVHVFRTEVRAFYGLEKMWAGGSAGRRRAS